MRKLLPTLILLVSFLLSTPTLCAQQDTSDWSRLNSVTSQTKLRVELKNGKKVEGKLANVSDVALTLTVKNAPLELKRDDVQSVYQIIKKSAAKSTLIGLGVGAGTGALIGAAADASTDAGSFEKVDNIGAGIITVIGATAGAAAGFFIGKFGTKRILLYRTK
jgi:hypothetical protein